MLQLFIGTRQGVRIEFVAIRPTNHNNNNEEENADCLLELAYGFQGPTMRVRAWNAPACVAERVSAARFRMPHEQTLGRLYDGDSSSSSSSEEEEPTTTTTTTTTEDAEEPRVLNRKRVAATNNNKKKRRTTVKRRRTPSYNNNNKIELELTDCNPDDIGYIWAIMHPSPPPVVVVNNSKHKKRSSSMHPLLPPQPPAAVGSSSGIHNNTLPHPRHGFQVENTCGAFHTLLVDDDEDEPLLLLLPQVRRRSAAAAAACCAHGGELITMLSGTLVPCLNKRQVDFRGVRSLAALREDWFHLTRAVAARLTVYMMVLTARTGANALIIDYGIRPPGVLHETSARVAAEGQGRCYLAERMAAWCTRYTQHVDVCQAIELTDLKWDALLRETPLPLDDDPGLPIAPPLLVARSNAHISRRGGIMLRLIFPKDTPWDERIEHAVVRDCNRALLVLRRALQGGSSLLY